MIKRVEQMDLKSGIALCAMTLLMSGCIMQPEPDMPVVDDDAAMEFLMPGLRPEMLLFPDYLLMDEYELNQHGRIPESEMIGAGLRTKLNLTVVRGQFADVLAAQGWQTAKMEIDRQSFRLIAEHKEERVEIRAVQALGPTEIFILYDPGEPEPIHPEEKVMP